MFRYLRHLLQSRTLAYAVARRQSALTRDIVALQREREEFLVAYRRRQQNGEVGNVADMLYEIEQSGILPPTEPRFEQKVSALKQQIADEAVKIAKFETAYLVSQARHLVIPIPQNRGSAWIRNDELSLEGMAELRSVIRRERKERFEAYQSRLALFLSIVGAVTGIISLYISIVRKSTGK